MRCSKGGQGGAAQVRSILNRAVGADEEAVKQVSQSPDPQG